ncbi:MAG: TonB-dependent hemoglobin/transferrin/lactoferrin family receptor [Pseudomonadota bacterium]
MGGLSTTASAQESDSTVVELPPITVFGGARDQRNLLDTPNAVGVVSPDDVIRRQPSTYQELLADQPGVTIEGGPRAISQEPNIRGFSDDQVIIRVDGARQNFRLAHRGRFFTDPAILKQVEVLRGGASTLFGSGAIGGVIFLDTKDAADVVAPGETWGGEVKLGFNTQGSELLTAGTAAVQIDSFDALAFFAGRTMFDDLEDGEGDVILGSDIDSQNGLLKLGFEPSDALRLEGSYQIYRDSGETPPNANVQGTTGPGGNLVERDLTYQTARLELDFDPADNDLIDLSALVYYNDVDVEEDRLFDGRFDETDFDTLGFEATNITRLDAGLPISLSYGIEIFQDTQEARRDGAPRVQAPDAKRRFYAGFLQADIGLSDTLTVTPGIRYDFFQLRPDSSTFSDRSAGQPSPRLALNWRPTEELQFFASASRSFRAPTLTELYVDGVHFVTPGFPLGRGPGAPVFTGINQFVPTPDLEPERATQFEIGARYRGGDVVFAGDSLLVTGNVYYALVDDFIDTNVVFIDDATATFNPITRQLEIGGTTTNRNVDAKLFGFEGSLSYDTEDVFAGLSITIPRGSQRNGGGELGAIPQDRIVVTAGIRPLADVEIGARGTFAGGINAEDVPADGLTTPGYAVFDLFANWQPSSGPLAGAVFSAGVDNITDRRYRVHPNGLNSVGIAGKVSVNVPF